MLKNFRISGTSPDAEGTAAGAEVTGLSGFRITQIFAELVGATGGTLDVYLQREVEGDWVDWCHFTQLLGGGAAVKYSIPVEVDTRIVANHIVAVGKNTTPVLAAGVFAGGQPGDKVRALYVAGALTSEGAAVRITMTGQRI